MFVMATLLAVYGIGTFAYTGRGKYRLATQAYHVYFCSSFQECFYNFDVAILCRGKKRRASLEEFRPNVYVGVHPE